MPDTANTERLAAVGVSLPSSSRVGAKACDACRARKVRCDRRAPCANCLRSHAECHTSPRASRSKRPRGLLSSNYDEKINVLGTRLDRISDLMNQVVTDKIPFSTPISAPTQSPRSSETSPPTITTEFNGLGGLGGGLRASGSSNRNETVGFTEDDELQAMCEGTSSLSAHSSQAIDFLTTVAGMDRMKGHVFETAELLQTLHHIVDAVKTKRPPPSITSTDTQSMAAPASYSLPPIQASVEAIQKARDSRSVMFLCLNKLLQPQSISDLCLKVYCSQEKSTAESVNLNVALFYLFYGIVDLNHNSEGISNSRYMLLCQDNLQVLLAGLPIQTRPSHETSLALCLAAVYHIELGHPSQAWIFASAAYQMACSMGYHSRAQAVNEASNTLNQYGLLFWTIYYLEKQLSVRLGRCSIILDHDITIPLPGGGLAMNYCGIWVRSARLASRTYEDLYSALALTRSDDVRRVKVSELSGELDCLQQESHDILQAWLESSTDEAERAVVAFTEKSDEVLHLSLRTLIHRACMAPAGSGSLLTTDCIQSAKAALDAHGSFIVVNDLNPIGLSTYIHWTILFSPFIPFMVVFCQALETGSMEDVSRLQTFVASIEAAAHSSNTISRHYRLFKVFSEVAQRYVELKAASTPDPEHNTSVRAQMDGCLSELGFSVRLNMATAGSSSQVEQNGEQTWNEVPGVKDGFQHSGGGFEVGVPNEAATHLAQWHASSHLMMDWLDDIFLWQ